MADIQAAIGIQQLRRLPAMHARRRAIVEQYNAAFRQMPGFETPCEKRGISHAWHLYVLRVNAAQLGISRNEFIQELGERNIGSSVHFIPLHMHPYYRDKYTYAREDFPVAAREFDRIVSLPLSPRMTDGDVDDVIEAVKDIAFQHRAAARAYMAASHR